MSEFGTCADATNIHRQRTTSNKEARFFLKGHKPARHLVSPGCRVPASRQSATGWKRQLFLSQGLHTPSSSRRRQCPSRASTADLGFTEADRGWRISAASANRHEVDDGCRTVGPVFSFICALQGPSGAWCARWWKTRISNRGVRRIRRWRNAIKPRPQGSLRQSASAANARPQQLHSGFDSTPDIETAHVKVGV